MPDGRVMRIDPERQCVYIVRRGRSYEAPLSEVETAARVPSARVNFSLRRIKGVESAENVTLRVGTRTRKRQRRFGDLSGAKSPGTKIKTMAQKEFGIDVTTQPFRVVGAWVTALSDADIDAAVSLYLPGATVHTPEGAVTGRSRIAGVLERSEWRGIDTESVDLYGMDQLIRASASAPDLPDIYVALDAGQIHEQWVGSPPDDEALIAETPRIRIEKRGAVPDGAIDYAHHKIEHFAASHPITSAQIKLTEAKNPVIQKPALAEIAVESDGSLVRAHIAASTMNEAIDLMMDRVRSKLETLADRHRHDPSGMVPVSGQWRHGNLLSDASPFAERSPQEREIVRHKSFAPGEMTVEEAAWDMALLDYDFFLFNELSSGLDALLERTKDGTLALHGIEASEEQVHSTVVDITSGFGSPPRLKLSEAIEFLDTAGTRFVFFENESTSRRNVLYRRFDGHYGLLTPPTDV